MRTTAGLGAALLVLLVAGCSVSVGATYQVAPDELASQVSSMLEDQVGVAPDSVDCPDPLPGEAGSSVRCTLTADGVTYGLTASSTGVTDGVVAVSVQVDDEPLEDAS